jgi:hypothetical protein
MKRRSDQPYEELKLAAEQHLALIKRAFPGNVLVEYISNFDDHYHGFYISPQPLTTIAYRIEMSNQYQLLITSYTMRVWTIASSMMVARGNDHVNYQKMFFGHIPACEDGPDEEFIEKILRNWKSIG